MNLLMILVICAAVLALAFAAFNFFKVKKMPEGTEQMSEIASAIRVGANAFISYEYKVLYTVVAVVAVIMAIVTTWHAALALLIGSIMSGCAGMIGMKIATYANVRVSNKARETEDIGETVKVAFRGGSVMGLCVGGFALLGLFLVYMIFGLGMHQAVETEASYVNLIGLKFVPFTMTLSGYALGCSMVAMFNRVGGGIYTKAADMGASSARRKPTSRRTTPGTPRPSPITSAITSATLQVSAPTCWRAMSARSPPALFWRSICLCSPRPWAQGWMRICCSAAFSSPWSLWPSA